MVKFADALACGGVGENGNRIISPGTIDLMRTDFLDDHQRRTVTWSHLTGYGYGLGVRTHIDHRKSGSLGPDGEFGWQGAAGTVMIVDPQNKISVFYAQAMLDNHAAYILPRLRNLVYTCLAR